MVVPKFRAWDKKCNEMFKDTFAITESGQVIIVEQKSVFVAPDYVFTDDMILMQSTGLVDKNGQEIFEGDIVHAYSEDARLIGAIEYFDNAYCVKTKNGVYNSLWINAEYYEVIGNIYGGPTNYVDKALNGGLL